MKLRISTKRSMNVWTHKQKLCLSLSFTEMLSVDFRSKIRSVLHPDSLSELRFHIFNKMTAFNNCQNATNNIHYTVHNRKLESFNVKWLFTSEWDSFVATNLISIVCWCLLAFWMHLFFFIICELFALFFIVPIRLRTIKHLKNTQIGIKSRKVEKI